MIENVQQLEDILSAPSPAVVEALAGLDGDLLIIGGSGKMGPSLARLAQRAIAAAGSNKRVRAVSRFSSPESRQALEQEGIETIAADLLNPDDLAALPDAANVIYMLGMKFGTTGREYETWATNTYVPGRVAERYPRSRIVVFSTGNVYPLTPVTRGGATEEHPTDPAGEYAQSCLGRERTFEYFSRRFGTPVTLFRLNYAIDLRYGVVYDIGKAVYEGRPVSLAMGNANVIWQGDANAFALRALTVCASPPYILNVTGPETISVRSVAEQFASAFGTTPQLVGEEAPTALLSNAGRAFRLFGYPRVTIQEMVEWTAHWIRQGGPTLAKPTHFQEREGRF